MDTIHIRQFHIFTMRSVGYTKLPTLKKIIILKQIPRYDDQSSNPPGFKSSLSKVFNESLDQLWSDCAIKEKLIIGNHNLDCSGGVFEARYRNIQSDRFDGVHMYGPSGIKAYTGSVLNVLSSAKLVKVNPPKYHEDDHKSCNQARYQAKQKKLRQLHSTQHRQRRAPDMDSNHHTHLDYQYSVPTYSRFSQLGDFFPGNY